MSLLDELTESSRRGITMVAEQKTRQLEILQEAEASFEEYMESRIEGAIAHAHSTALKTGKILRCIRLDMDWHHKLQHGYPVHIMMYGKQLRNWSQRELFPSWKGHRPFRKIIAEYAPRCYIRDDSDPTKSFSPYVRIYTSLPPPRSKPLWHDKLDGVSDVSDVSNVSNVSDVQNVSIEIDDKIRVRAHEPAVIGTDSYGGD